MELNEVKAVENFAEKLKAEFREIYNPGFSDLLDRQIDKVLNSVVNSDVN